MEIIKLNGELAVCQLPQVPPTPPDPVALWSLTLTPDEISLVCPAELVPDAATAVETGWRAFRVTGPLDFSLVGLLAELTDALAQAGIPVFALSTYATDYLLVKAADADDAAAALAARGYDVRPEV